MSAVELAARGRFGEALAALAREEGLPLRGRLFIDAEFDPRRVMLSDGRERPEADAAAARSGLAVLARRRARRKTGPAERALEGALLTAAGRFEEAVRRLEISARRHPGEPWLALWLFRARARGDFMTPPTADMLSGLEELDRAIALDAGNAHAFAWRSRALKSLNLVPESLADIERVVALRPDYDWARLGRGNLRAELGDADGALADAAYVVARRGSEPWPWGMRARIRSKLGDLAGALADLERAVELGPDWAALRAWRGEAKRQAKRLPEAEADLREALRQDPACALAWHWLGRLLMTDGRAAEARRCLDRSLKLVPGNSVGRAYRFQLGLEAGRWDEALEDYAWISPMRPQQFWAPRRDAASIRAGLAAGTARRPKDAWAWTWRGRVEATLEPLDAAAALGFYDEALKRDPDHAWARLWRGELLLLWRGPAEARPDLEAAAKLEPRAALPWLGRCLLDAGKVDAALAALDRARRLAPDDNRARAWRGEALVRAGRPEQALSELTASRVRLAGGPEPLYWRGQAQLLRVRRLKGSGLLSQALGELRAMRAES